MALDWQERRIGEFATRKKVINERGHDLPPLSVTKDRGVVLQSEKYNKRVATDPKKYVIVGDGDFAFDPMGLYYGALGRVVGIERGLISPDYVAFNVDGSIDPVFVEYLLRSPPMVHKYNVVAQAGNQFGKRRRVYWSVLHDMTVTVPPLLEQRKIAAIISSVDDAIEKIEAVINQLEVVSKGMLDSLFTEISEGRVPETIENPGNWRTLTIGELAEFSGGTGFRPSDWSSSGLPIIRIQNLNGSEVFNYFAGEPQPEWIVEPGELLFAWAGSRGSSFGPCVWPGPRGVLNQHIHRIKPYPFVDKRFLFFALKRITAIIERRAHGFKDTLVHLRKAELTGWRVALPVLAEQDRLSAVLESVDDRLRVERRAATSVRLVKAAVLDALLSGRTRIPASTQEAT